MAAVALGSGEIFSFPYRSVTRAAIRSFLQQPACVRVHASACELGGTLGRTASKNVSSLSGPVSLPVEAGIRAS